MIRYKLYQKNPASHYIYIDLIIEKAEKGKIHLQLPSWRPGRYELGNFAKNIKRVDVWNANNEALKFSKLNKDLWEFEVKEAGDIKVTYSYFANELNAGACYADPTQMYVNPVHCCMAVKGRESEEHVLELEVPENYKIATSLKVSERTLTAANYEELLDSPFIASAQLVSESFKVDGITSYLHFNGECKPDFKKIKEDFTAFTRKQVEFWGEFPVSEYHYLFQVLPVKFYHGVEHLKSTVIAIGPGYAINTGTTYEDVLGVSSHELFHTWNVKTIRPTEMLPYDYSRENYARTGYVYEGFTTYYGDKLLLTSGVFNLRQYFVTLQERLQKHFHNFGRYNLSVADSSWETWLDGYVPGAPYRKTNIYDEGSLVAFMLDVQLLKDTENKKSLREVCRLLYERFGKKGRGYSEEDIIQLINEVAGKSYVPFFEKYVYSAADFEEGLNSAFEYLGLEMQKKEALTCENKYGFKIAEAPGTSKVTLVAPYSPAWKSGLFAGDDLIAVNNLMVRNSLNNWLEYFKEEESITLTIASGEQLRTVQLQQPKKPFVWFFSPQLKVKESLSDEQKKNFEAWLLK